MAHFEGCRIGAELEITVAPSGKTWVARLEGTDEKFGLERTFVRSAVAGLRVAFYPVENGLYESQSGAADRQYWKVEGMRVQEISRDEAISELEGEQK